MADITIRVSKLDAAKRQLRTAIELWFKDGDPVSIHTLVSAAHEVIHTLFRRKGLRGLMFDSPLIVEKYRADFAKGMKAQATFYGAQLKPSATESRRFAGLLCIDLAPIVAAKKSFLRMRRKPSWSWTGTRSANTLWTKNPGS